MTFDKKGYSFHEHSTKYLLLKTIVLFSIAICIVVTLFVPLHTPVYAFRYFLSAVLFCVMVYFLVGFLIFGQQNARLLFYRTLISHNTGLILVIMIFGVLVYFGLQTVSPLSLNNVTTEYYVLSAVAQSLAAIFALVFTITLIVVQSVTSHTDLIDTYFKDSFNAIVYPCFNGACIIFSLICLRLSCFGWSTNLSLAGAFISIFWAIPFILRTKDFIKYHVGIRRYSEKARSSLDSRNIDQYLHVIRHFYYSLAPDAISRREYDIFVGIMLEMYELCKLYYRKIREMGKVLKETLSYYLVFFIWTYRYKILEGQLWDFELVKITDLIDIIPFNDRDFYHQVIHALLELFKIATDDRTKRVICRDIWLFSAKWLVRNKDHWNLVANKMRENLTKINRDLFLQCCSDSGEQDSYSNAIWAVDSNSKEDLKLRELRTKVIDN